MTSCVWNFSHLFVCPQPIVYQHASGVGHPQLVTPKVHLQPWTDLMFTIYIARFLIGTSHIYSTSSSSDFPGGSDAKASAYNAGDLGLIPGSGRSLEKEMATHSSTRAWKIPWTEECGRLQFMGPQRVGHDWATSLSLFSSSSTLL